MLAASKSPASRKLVSWYLTSSEGWRCTGCLFSIQKPRKVPREEAAIEARSQFENHRCEDYQSRNTSTEAATPLRKLVPHYVLRKYVISWECSGCGFLFALSDSERQSLEVYEYQPPSRIQQIFESHDCSSNFLK